MAPSEPATGAAPDPVVSLDDPRAVQILSTEHWSLLTARSLAYNEAFVRGGMFLAFLSTSFVALALLAQAMTFGDRFLAVAAIVLAFDLVIGLATYGRINGANADDLRAVHGIARIRHGYTQIAPVVAPYFTSATHDDPVSVVTAYGPPTRSALATFGYVLTTSAGMIGLITSMVGGVLATVLATIRGASGGIEVWIGVAGAVLTFLILLVIAMAGVQRNQAAMIVLFPAPETETGTERRTTV